MSFLLGRTTADLDLAVQFQSVPAPVVGGMRVAAQVWPGSIDYTFMAADAPVGTTGIQDLGPVSFMTTAGTFWTSQLAVVINMTQYAWCTIGSETHTNGGAGGTQLFHVPFSSLPVASIVADAARTQFRAAAEFAANDTHRRGYRTSYAALTEASTARAAPRRPR
ncbi:MAG TPA: hypothetical protein VHW23_28790 [Kofleriaceae bacterium]|nr:hypothetical protein [Kofleriaceae bacterium]